MTFCCVLRLLFYFLVNLVESKFIFHAQFSCVGFFILIHNLKWWFQFKTINNLSLKIYCEIIVDVKNKISDWDLPQLEIKDIVKMLWYFVMFLGFFFGLVKFGEPKFTVSDTIFFNWLFVCFLNAQFKTNNNLPPKICCENIVNIPLL